MRLQRVGHGLATEQQKNLTNEQTEAVVGRILGCRVRPGPYISRYQTDPGYVQQNKNLKMGTLP